MLPVLFDDLPSMTMSGDDLSMLFNSDHPRYPLLDWSGEEERPPEEPLPPAPLYQPPETPPTTTLPPFILSLIVKWLGNSAEHAKVLENMYNTICMFQQFLRWDVLCKILCYQCHAVTHPTACRVPLLDMLLPYKEKPEQFLRFSFSPADAHSHMARFIPAIRRLGLTSAIAWPSAPSQGDGAGMGTKDNDFGKAIAETMDGIADFERFRQISLCTPDELVISSQRLSPLSGDALAAFLLGIHAEHFPDMCPRKQPEAYKQVFEAIFQVLPILKYITQKDEDAMRKTQMAAEAAFADALENSLEQGFDSSSSTDDEATTPSKRRKIPDTDHCPAPLFSKASRLRIPGTKRDMPSDARKIDKIKDTTSVLAYVTGYTPSAFQGAELPGGLKDMFITICNVTPSNRFSGVRAVMGNESVLQLLELLSERKVAPKDVPLFFGELPFVLKEYIRQCTSTNKDKQDAGTLIDMMNKIACDGTQEIVKSVAASLGKERAMEILEQNVSSYRREYWEKLCDKRKNPLRPGKIPNQEYMEIASKTFPILEQFSKHTHDAETTKRMNVSDPYHFAFLTLILAMENIEAMVCAHTDPDTDADIGTVLLIVPLTIYTAMQMFLSDKIYTLSSIRSNCRLQQWRQKIITRQDSVGGIILPGHDQPSFVYMLPFDLGEQTSDSFKDAFPRLPTRIIDTMAILQDVLKQKYVDTSLSDQFNLVCTDVQEYSRKTAMTKKDRGDAWFIAPHRLVIAQAWLHKLYSEARDASPELYSAIKKYMHTVHVTIAAFSKDIPKDLTLENAACDVIAAYLCNYRDLVVEKPDVEFAEFCPTRLQKKKNKRPAVATRQERLVPCTPGDLPLYQPSLRADVPCTPGPYPPVPYTPADFIPLNKSSIFGDEDQ